MKLLFIFLLGLILYGCSSINSNESNVIRIKGSDTMLLLNQRLAEEFMKDHEGLSVYVDGGGTKTGVEALIKNTVEICAASRPIEPEEIKKLGEEFSTVGMSFLIARDALSIYINSANKVKNLTIKQIGEIFQCKIKNWNELGGEDEIILPITRTSVSGTYLYFIKHVLRGENICGGIKTANTTRNIINFIKNNKNAIGYGGVGYIDETMECAVEGILPTQENVIENNYPISRYLRYYTSRKPKGNVKLFIDWVTSKRGQNIIKSMGYFSLWN